MSYKTHNRPWQPPAGPLMVPTVPVERKPCTCPHAPDDHDPQAGCLSGWEVEGQGCPCEGGIPVPNGDGLSRTALADVGDQADHRTFGPDSTQP